MTLHRRNWLAACCLLLSFASLVGYGQTGTARATYKDVEVVGSAPITEGDVERARQAARAQALRNAVEQVLGIYISSETLVRNFATVRDEIVTRAEGYASIIKESEARQGDHCILRATVRVYLIDSKDDSNKSWQGLLQDLQRRGELRSKEIAVIFPQGSEEVEAAIREALLREKFKLVSPERVQKLREDQLVQQMLRGEIDLARLHELHKRSLADILITGRIAVTHRGTVGRIGVYDVRIGYQAILLDTAEIVAEASEEAKGVQALEASLALKKGTDIAIPKLAPALTRDLLLGVFGNILTRVSVEVGGFERFADSDAFEGAVRSVSGVQRVYRQSYAGGVLTLEVEVERAQRQRLTGALETLQLNGFRVRVRTDTPSRIEAQVVYQAANISSAEPAGTVENKPTPPKKPKRELPVQPSKP